MPPFSVQPSTPATQHAATAPPTTALLPPTPNTTHRRLSTPGTGSASKLKAMFEQRAAEQAAEHRQSQPRLPSSKRQSNGSTSSGCSSAREARRTAPDTLQGAPDAVAVSTTILATPTAAPT